MEEIIKPLTIYPPKKLRDSLQKMADKDDRKLSRFVVKKLEEIVKKDNKNDKSSTSRP